MEPHPNTGYHFDTKGSTGKLVCDLSSVFAFSEFLHGFLAPVNLIPVGLYLSLSNFFTLKSCVSGDCMPFWRQEVHFLCSDIPFLILENKGLGVFSSAAMADLDHELTAGLVSFPALPTPQHMDTTCPTRCCALGKVELWGTEIGSGHLVGKPPAQSHPFLGFSWACTSLFLVSFSNDP